MKKEELANVICAEHQTFNVVFMGVDEVRYEGGWWMKRSDYDRLFRYVPELRRYIKDDSVGIDRNENTKQLTIFYLPV